MTFTIFHFARGSEESISDCPDVFEGLTLSLMWRGKHSRPDAWRKRWKRAAWIKRLFSRTFDHSRSGDFVDWWTSLVADSRASHSRALDSDKEPKILDTCGHRSNEDFKSAYHESLFSKTWTGSCTRNPKAITAFSTMSLATWKSWVTEQQRLGLVREKSGRLTGDDGGSFLELWPTPRASNPGSRKPGTGGKVLAQEVKKHPGCAALWPTPTAQMSPESKKSKLKRGNNSGVNLAQMVRDWPTPSARDWKDTPGMSSVRPDRAGAARKADQLPRAVFNTQTAPDPNTKTSRRVYLNPAWVETLMGFPIGWTDLEHWETQ
jgi:hypothetical protein